MTGIIGCNEDLMEIQFGFDRYLEGTWFVIYSNLLPKSKHVDEAVALFPWWETSCLVLVQFSYIMLTQKFLAGLMI